MKIRFIPRDDNINGWSAILPQRQPSSPLLGAVQADWLVIGAGYAGLAFARAVAEQDSSAKIVLLEAGIAGDGAAGRNSGFAIDLPHNIGSSTAELAKAANYRRLLKGGLDQLQQLIDRYQIACDWQQSGKYHCGVQVGSHQVLDQYAHELDQLGEEYEYLDQAELSRRLGTTYYRSAIYTPHSFLLNPAALVRGLADHLPENVSLYEHSPVLTINQQGGIRATTPTGEVTARRVMFATNGAAGQLAPFADKLASLATYASLTAPLTLEQQARIGAVKPWGMTPVNAIAGATFRYTADHRLLIRQQVEYAPALTRSAQDTAQVRARHRKIFVSRFPQLADVALEHTWSGLISVTRNGAPIWGQVRPGVYAALGCNGAGVSKQTIAGHALADLAYGIDSPWVADMQALGQANYIPPRPFLDLGVQGHLWRERLLGRGEY